MKAFQGIAVTGAALGLLTAGAGAAAADAPADGSASQSPGAVSGNLAQVPVHLPVTVCGDTINGIGALTPSLETACDTY